MDGEEEFSRLSSEFSKLNRPTRRVLMAHNIFSASDLSKVTSAEFWALRGIGPSAFYLCSLALKDAGLAFKR